MVKDFLKTFNPASKKKVAYLMVVVFIMACSVGLIGPMNQSVFANDGSVNTTFFGNIKDEGDGCGVYLILNYIIDFLAFGVGIAAVIGITVSGITYMTAGGNMNKTIKAKRRIYEIVIGLIVYLTLWSILSFILPGGVLNNTPQCGKGTDFDSFFTDPNETASGGNDWSHYGYTRRAASGANLSNSMSGGSGNMLSAASVVAELMVKAGYKYSESPNGGRLSNLKKGKKGTANCATYASLVAQEAGLLRDGQTVWIDTNGVGHESYAKKKFQKIDAGGKSVASLVRDNKLVPGDMIGMASSPHTMIYAGKKNGKHYYWSGGRAATNTRSVGGTYKDTKKFYTTYTSSCKKGGCKISWILHPK